MKNDKKIVSIHDSTFELKHRISEIHSLAVKGLERALKNENIDQSKSTSIETLMKKSIASQNDAKFYLSIIERITKLQ